MGQENTTAENKSIEGDTNNAPIVIKAKIALDEGSVMRPNGFFPPEIITYILQYSDENSCIRLSQLCKLCKYISKYGKAKLFKGDWKANFFRRTLADRNLKKGLWWAEALSATVQSENWQVTSYIVSFDDNKAIINTPVLQVNADYSYKKLSEAAFLLDLDTMKRVPIDYGTIFANGFKITTLIKNDNNYFDWKEFTVDDGTTKRIIRQERKREALPGVENSRPCQTSYQVLVNNDGSPTVLTMNMIKTYGAFEHNIEVVDLRTGENIAELQLTVYIIRALIGDEVLADFSDGLQLVNIFTKERRKIPNAHSTYTVHYYCQESHRIGFIDAHGGITIHEWPSLKIESQIGIIDKIKVAPRDPRDTLFTGSLYIQSFAFDKSKLVVTLNANSSFFAAFDVHTGELMQTFYNPSDGRDRGSEGGAFGAIYLAPNGKIVTDYANLTVYDFVSPMIDKKLPVVLVEPDIINGDTRLADKVVKSYLSGMDLVDFVIKTLDAPIEKITHRTLYKEEKGVQYRLTCIGTHSNDPSMFRTTKRLSWPQLATYLDSWKCQLEVKNTFQLTKSNVTDPKPYLHKLVWTNLSKVILVYERYNQVTNEWEFSEPIGLEECIH